MRVIAVRICNICSINSQVAVMTSSAVVYSKVSSLQAEDGLTLIDRLSPLKGSRALDLGCGTGYLASVLAERVGSTGTVTGVDPDTERIRLAREEYGIISNLEFLEGNDKEFPDGPYDVVFSNQVMHWIEDKVSVFQKVFQNLTLGGKFAFRCGGSIGPIAFQVEALMDPGKPKLKDYFHFCPPDVYETFASRCGFQMEFKSVGSKQYNFPNIEALLEWMYASTSGKLDYHSIDDTVLDKFKKNFGDESALYEVNVIEYIFTKI